MQELQTNGPMMATPGCRPEYDSFDCYGTLINYQTEHHE